MNTTLFKTPYLPAGALICAAFLTWWILGGFTLGRGAQGDVGYLLWTGWIAVALYVAVIVYVGRKYVHRVKKPPTREEVKKAQAATDRASARIKEVEREILSGTLRAESDIRDRAEAIVKQEGVWKFSRPYLVPGEEGQPAYRIELRSNEPAGRVAVWLHAHLYFGIAAAVLVILHGGFVLTTPMGLLLNLLSVVVTVTGVFGVYYWAKGPLLLTRAEDKLTIEESFSLEQHFARKLSEAFAEPKKDPEKEVDKAYEKDKAVYDEVIKLRPFAIATKEEPSAETVRAQLESVLSDDPKIAEAQRAVTVLIAQRAKVGAELKRLSRIRFLINAWRVVHVPASIALVGILLIHIFTVWWY